MELLYVCESLGEYALHVYGDERHWGYTEHDAVRYFMLSLHALNAPVNRIVIRPHPAEDPSKYHWVLQGFHLSIVIEQGKFLMEEVMDCDVVVGCSSMATVVEHLAKKRVASAIPPGGMACSLPQPEIEQLSSLRQRRT